MLLDAAVAAVGRCSQSRRRRAAPRIPPLKHDSGRQESYDVGASSHRWGTLNNGKMKVTRSTTRKYGEKPESVYQRKLQSVEMSCTHQIAVSCASNH